MNAYSNKGGSSCEPPLLLYYLGQVCSTLLTIFPVGKVKGSACLALYGPAQSQALPA